MQTAERIVDADNNFEDPQLCATLACDIYNYLRNAEVIFILLKTLFLSTDACKRPVRCAHRNWNFGAYSFPPKFHNYLCLKF